MSEYEAVNTERRRFLTDRIIDQRNSARLWIKFWVFIAAIGWGGWVFLLLRLALA